MKERTPTWITAFWTGVGIVVLAVVLSVFRIGDDWQHLILGVLGAVLCGGGVLLSLRR